MDRRSGGIAITGASRIELNELRPGRSASVECREKREIALRSEDESNSKGERGRLSNGDKDFLTSGRRSRAEKRESID